VKETISLKLDDILCSIASGATKSRLRNQHPLKVLLIELCISPNLQVVHVQELSMIAGARTVCLVRRLSHGLVCVCVCVCVCMQWERIIVFVVAVVAGVLILHLLIELLTSKYKAWKRKRLLLSSTSAVHFSNGGGSSSGVLSADWVEPQSEDYSDMEETSNLMTSFKETSSSSRTEPAKYLDDRGGYDSSGSHYDRPCHEELHKESGREDCSSVEVYLPEREMSSADLLSDREGSFVENLIVVDSDSCVDVGVVSEGGEHLAVDGSRCVDGWNSVNLAVDTSLNLAVDTSLNLAVDTSLNQAVDTSRT